MSFPAGIPAHVADNPRCWSDVVPRAKHRLLRGPVGRLDPVMFTLAPCSTPGIPDH